MNKSELRERVHTAHTRLVKAFDGLTEEEATRTGLNPQWSIKDALAHLAAWDTQGAVIISKILREGVEPPDIDKKFIDDFNARAVAERGSHSMREVADEFNAAHSELENVLAEFPDELDESSRAFKLFEILAVTHYTHHAEQIEKFRAEG